MTGRKLSQPVDRGLACADAIEWLKTFDAESVDLVVSDPPYESLEKHRAVGTTTRLKVSDASSNQWFKIFPNDRFPQLFCEVWRVLKRNTHFYMYCDQETMFVVKPMAEAHGFKFWKPIVWDKVTIGMGYHYRARYEFILFFEKGKRRLNDLGIADIITSPRVRGTVCDFCNGGGVCRNTGLVGLEHGGETQRVISRSGLVGSTGSNTSSSGSSTTDQFQEGSRSTTRTKTKSTIGSRTSKFSTQHHTSEFIPGVNSETEFGGSRVVSAGKRNRSPKNIGILQQTDVGQSLDVADLVISELSSDVSKPSVCKICGRVKRVVFPTEKPHGVSEILIAQSSTPGDLVVDPFMGSGSVGVAALNVGCRFAGCDLAPDAVELARKRVAHGRA